MFTEGDEEGVLNPDELVVGKKKGTGLKMSVIKFDLSELQELHNDKNIWIYESNIFLTVSPTSEGKHWKSQITKLHRLAVPWDEVVTNVGQLTSEQNIDESTGQTKKLEKEPTRDVKLKTDFKETLHKWISPYNKNKNEDYYGVALVSQYVDGSDESTDAMDVRYYNFDNVTEEDKQPWLDICYKEVEIKECEEPYEPVEADIVSSVVLVKGEETKTNETLTHGQDNDGKTYRTVLKFDLEKFSEKFKSYQINESFIHLNYLGPSDEESPVQRTVTVHKITAPWTEDDITFENVEYEDEPSGTLVIEESRLGGTEVTIPIHDLTREWIEKGVIDNYGVLLKDTAEDERNSVPIYAHDDTEQYHYPPKLTVCQHREQSTSSSTPILTTTVPTTEPIATQTTPMVVYEPYCESRTKEPVEKITVWVVNDTVIVDPDDYDPEDRTLCVSTNAIKIKYCWDLTGKCKKQQRRDIYGKIETNCNCCLPILKTVETHTFDCFGEIRPRALKMEMISSCKCQICGRETADMILAGDNEIIEQDRGAGALLLL